MTSSTDEADQSGDEPTSWLAPLGIHDRQSALLQAEEARKWLLVALGTVAEYPGSQASAPAVAVFSGLLTRACGLHDGIVAAIAADNPFAAFPLIRSYAENAAAVLYATDHPRQLERIAVGRRAEQVKIGTMTNYAAPKFTGWKQIYNDLSNYAHPHRLSLMHGLAQKGNSFELSVTPAFRSDTSYMTACGWTVEMARHNGQLLVSFARGQRMLAPKIETPDS